MNKDELPTRKGRGSFISPPNRFETSHHEPDFEHLEHDEEFVDSLGRQKTEFVQDTTQSVVTENDSPDIGFRYSLNPYRGCEHGCAYCYARPSHEYLGYNAGIDFESRILVKTRAPELFAEWLARDRWKPEPIIFSGVTDCYQPAERKFELTRGCLRVALEARQPICIITKNALVLRDLDVLEEMARWNIISVAISVTSLDHALARTLEPRTSPPAARLRAIAQLSAAGVPVRVMVAPVIPGLNDSEIPAILSAASEAGAQSAGFVLLRLPLAVRPVFLEWLRVHEPTRASRVESLIRTTRQGKLNDPNFGSRMRGKGPLAEQIEQTFRVFTHKHGLDKPIPPLETARFRPPRCSRGQLRLF
ncbi:MAG: PA0069 family radical SAM protein [Planctomycetaceae bacterium]